jgi:hypothetical protein
MKPLTFIFTAILLLTSLSVADARTPSPLYFCCMDLMGHEPYEGFCEGQNLTETIKDHDCEDIIEAENRAEAEWNQFGPTIYALSIIIAAVIAISVVYFIKRK